MSSQLTGSDFLEGQACKPPLQEQEQTQSIIKRSLNPVAIIYIFILLVCIIAWTVLTSLVLFTNEEPMYPKPVIGVPFLIILSAPPTLSLTVILFRTFYTVWCPDDTETLEPLDLAGSESQRLLLLLPLSVSGLVMTILPAYYFNYGKYYAILGSQAGIGFMLLLLFLGIALIPEKAAATRNNIGLNHWLFMTILEKQ